MDDSTRQRMQSLVASHHVVLFMKGTKLFPQCGFSAQVVGILKKLGAEFKDVNILTDDEVRSGM